MSGVNVLAVMDANTQWAQQVADRGGIPQRVREAASGVAYQQGLARAAVAELIEADRAFDAAVAAHGIGSRWSIEADERRRAAIARATGEQP